MQAPFSRTLFDLACEQAERYPDREAVVGSERRLTYAQLRDSAMRLAGGLRAHDIGPHDRVGLLLNNRPEWVEICFAVAALGAVLLPFSTWSKRPELEFLFKDSRIKLVISAERLGDQDFAQDIAALQPAFPDLAVVMMNDAYATLASSSPIDAAPPPGDGGRAEDPALILYTSGSTSYPKAVPLRH